MGGNTDSPPKWWLPACIGWIAPLVRALLVRVEVGVQKQIWLHSELEFRVLELYSLTLSHSKPSPFYQYESLVRRVLFALHSWIPFTMGEAVAVPKRLRSEIHDGSGERWIISYIH